MKTPFFYAYLIFSLIWIAPAEVFGGHRSPAAQGGSSDGGGTSCFNHLVNQGRRTLLDIAKVGFQDTAGEKIDETIVAEKVGFDEFNYQTTNAFQFARKRVQYWASLKLMSKFSELNTTLNQLDIYFTPSSPKKVNRAVLDADAVCTYDQLKPIIFFFNGRVHVSLEAWNELGFYSQAGAFIHEALRQRQILHNDKISDLLLQKLTAQILFGTAQSDAVALTQAMNLLNNPDTFKVDSAWISFCASYTKLRTNIKGEFFAGRSRAIKDASLSCTQHAQSSVEQQVQSIQTVIDDLQILLVAAANTGDNQVGLLLKSIYQDAMGVESALKSRMTMGLVDTALDSANRLNVLSLDGVFLMQVRDFLTNPASAPVGFEQTIERVKSSYSRMIESGVLLPD